MKDMTITRFIASVALGVSISFGVAAAVIAHGMAQSEARAKEMVRVTQPTNEALILEGRPSLDQKSIATAMEVYGIRVPTQIKGPFFDPKLEDRGLTMRRGVTSDPIVFVGPEAFSSWSMLGSTLAHEIEIHCRQNFLAIHFQNVAGMDGTTAAEREAYKYELANASRFGLTQYDQDLIRSTMSYFYPEQDTRFAQRFYPVRALLDRLSASGFKVRSL